MTESCPGMLCTFSLPFLEIGKIFAEMIRQDKVQIISCTGVRRDIMNLVAHSHYSTKLDLTPEQEWDLLEERLNRVTDTCIPEHEAFVVCKTHLQNLERWR
jgi:deoxyhypusine synthase